MPRTRILLSGLVVAGLALSACGGDDDAASDDPTTTTKPDDESTSSTLADDAIDVCGLIDLDVINDATGETFTKTEQTESDTCQVTNDESTALLQLSVRQLEADQTEIGFIEDGQSACDEGTNVADVDFAYAEGAGFACEISGEAALGVAVDGGAALLVGHPSDPSVTTAQIIGALNQIAESIVTA